ncbi:MULTISPECIES: hypothetical protein [unclassified Acinetobacter]|uniref:hypothetical protein n=1 Tax=unclassified Acinetobacter TaxID=196816 RepID=UPI0035B92F26
MSVFFNTKNTRFQHGMRALVAGSVMLLSALASNQTFANGAKYYRYTNSSGTPSISRTVTPEMIKRGYQELDGNMSLIRVVPAYNSGSDQRSNQQRAAQAEQARQDLIIKRAYGNVAYATQKRNEMMNSLQKQIDMQQQALARTQAAQQTLYTQRASFVSQRKPIPANIETNIRTNDAMIRNTNANIASLRTMQQNEAAKFDQIIRRLQSMN